MDSTKSILRDIRESVGLTSTVVEFDTELLQHINSAIGKLNQNGVGQFLVVQDEESIWEDLKESTQIEGNKYFALIPLFITLSTKLLFDPPPPSNVQYHASNAQELLWRLKIAYEEPYIEPQVEEV